MDIYVSLTYDEYKALEQQFRDFKKLETTHPGDGYYHKAFRVRVGDTTFEFNGPVVRSARRHRLPVWEWLKR